MNAGELVWVGPPEAAWTLILAHGASGDIDSPFMTAFAEGLAARCDRIRGLRVARFEFPYMKAQRQGKQRPPDREPVLLETWRDTIASVVNTGFPRERLLIGGKSLGGRMASLIADEQAVAGLICLGYPFHPPGKPERLRTAHLQALRTPALICQGSRDPFGSLLLIAEAETCVKGIVMSSHSPVFTLSKTVYPAAIFDLDGVITKTAEVHGAAWKAMFDEFLQRYADEHDKPFDPFDLDKDYRRYVDGKPRYEGVKSFLHSRGIELPYGDPEDSTDQETVCGLGNRKNQLFLEKVKNEGVKVFASSIELLRGLRNQGFKTAVVTSSKNCSTILEAAGIAELFDAQVDGVEAARLGLEGKPDPDIFVEAARRLQVKPSQAVVFEDAIAGVQAGRRGGFGCVVGVDRIGHPEALLENGADVVVDDLAKIGIEPGSGNEREKGALPSALECFADIAQRLQDKRLALFLDYDGTLTPIVDHPEQAVLSESMREAISELARYCTVAVVSGRDLGGVQRLVGLAEIFYAGSHGFDIAGPKGKHIEYQQGTDFLPALERAEQELWERLDEVPGCLVERKRFAIAIHYRQVAEEHLETVADVVEAVVQSHPELRKTGGKKIYELRPNIDWDKGRAVGWLLEVLELDRPDVLPFYIGDDETDEDAFRARRERGIGIRVEDEPKPSQAYYTLRDTDEVRRFFGALLDILKTHDQRL